MLYCVAVTINVVMTTVVYNFVGFSTNTRTNTEKVVGDF
jgi:hypothetical protein